MPLACANKTSKNALNAAQKNVVITLQFLSRHRVTQPHFALHPYTQLEIRGIRAKLKDNR